MKFEVLKRSHLKRKIIIGLFVVAVISATILNFTRAKYRITQSIPLATGTINYKRDTIKPVISNVISSVSKTSITVNVTASDNEGLAKYYYSINNGIYTESTLNSHTFNGLTAGTSYTVKVYVADTSGNESEVKISTIKTQSDVKTMQEILAGYNKSTRTDFSTTVTASTTKTVYSATDWTNKTSYYFAGNPTDNWVSFAGFYWRIIRMNGDGSTRLIYNGTSTATTGDSTLTRTSQKFNTKYNKSYYVGLSYSTTQHGTGTPSDILRTLDGWYQSNLASYDVKIDSSVGFCSDRNMASGYTWSAQPSSTIYYAAYQRLQRNKSPSLECSSSDVLKIPIGLITADEVAYAGGVYGTSNNGYYLYNGITYWTTSPSRVYSSGDANVFFVNSSDSLNYDYVDNTYGVRPVINLKADVKFTGSGKADDPFTVSS